MSVAEEFPSNLDGNTVSHADLEEVMIQYTLAIEELDRTQPLPTSGPPAFGKDETSRDIEPFTANRDLNRDGRASLRGSPWKRRSGRSAIAEV